MSDNQSWNSSGSEEDAEPRDESGHLVGCVDLSGVLSKVGHVPSPPAPPPVFVPASPPGITVREVSVYVPGTGGGGV